LTTRSSSRSNVNDFATLASRFNQPGTYSQGDFNYSGTVEIGDFAILASRFNQSLGRPSFAPAAAAAAGPVHSSLFSERRFAPDMEELDPEVLA
jgi:hypothetical protein